MLAEINRLRQMSVARLRDEWLLLHGEPTRSRNREFLFRRCAFRRQEIALGGLSERTKTRIAELAPIAEFVRARAPHGFDPAAPPPSFDAPAEQPRPVRDLRMPPVGSVITKTYKGRELRVVVREDSFEYDGRSFESLSALARFITGRPTAINGKLFFNLVGRKRR